MCLVAKRSWQLLRVAIGSMLTLKRRICNHTIEYLPDDWTLGNLEQANSNDNQKNRG